MMTQPEPPESGTGPYFLSHAGSDGDAAEALARGLVACGLPVWCDRLEGAMPSGPFTPVLEHALKESSGYLILMGRGAIRGWVRAELEYALNRQATHETSFPIRPILLPGVSIADLEEASPFLKRFDADLLPMAPAQLEQTYVQELVEKLRAASPAELPVEIPEDGPFPGLQVFGEDRALFFCGREAEIFQYLSLLGHTSTGYRRWLPILGESGAGKSSLVRAGLIPAVRRGWIDGRPGTWRVAIVRPGTEPLEQIALGLCASLQGCPKLPDPDELEEKLKRGPRALHRFLQGVSGLAKDEKLFLLFDQFEELFTNPKISEEVLKQLDELLATCIEDRESRLHLVTTMRSDYSAEMPHLPRLNRILQDVGPQYLARMDTASLQRAIEVPARMAKLRWRPTSLPQRIAKEAHEAPGGTAFLGYALMQIWHRCRKSHEVTEEDYASIFDGEGALVRDADALMQELEARSGPEDAWRVLLHLVAPASADRPTQRAIPLETAIELAGGGTDGHKVLHLLGGGQSDDEHEAVAPRPRLAVVGEDRVELAHEALLACWPAYATKINEDCERREIEARLLKAAETWVENGRRSDGLASRETLRYFREAETRDSYGLEFIERSARRLRRTRATLLAALLLVVTGLVLGARWYLDYRATRDLDAEIAVALQGEAHLAPREAWQEIVAKSIAASLSTVDFRAEDVRQRIDAEKAELEAWRKRVLARHEELIRAPPDEPEPWRSRNSLELANRLAGMVMASEEEWPQLELRLAELEQEINKHRKELVQRWQAVQDWIDRAPRGDPHHSLALRPRYDLLPLETTPVQKGSKVRFEFLLLGTGDAPEWGKEEDDTRERWLVNPESGIVMVLLPGGTTDIGGWDFTMHRIVTLTPFWIGAHELTTGQGQRLVEPDRWSGDLTLPVEEINWYESMGVTQVLGGRLPTEAEWEYACRAGYDIDKRLAKREEVLDEMGWFYGNSWGKPHAVGQKKPNEWGLYDMHGNVWEWCLDLFVFTNLSPKRGTDRAMRGGSWLNPRWMCRTTCRDPNQIVHRSDVLGFRVCLLPGPAVPVAVRGAHQ